MATDAPAVAPVPHAIGDNPRLKNQFQMPDAVAASLMQGSPIAMAVSTRSDGLLLAVNDRFVRLVDSPRDELIGQPLADLGLGRDPAQQAERAAALGEGETVREVEATIRTKSGAQRHMLAAVTDIEIGGRSYLLTQLSDVTAQRRAEQREDGILAFVSHEVRPSLTPILGGARVLRAKPHLDAATRAELLDDVIAESERLDRLLGYLGWLAGIMTGRLRAFPEPVLLAPLATRVSREVGVRAPAHTFVVDAAPDLPPADADPNLLEEVLRNLHENAVTYAPQGGPVRTTVVAEGAAIVTRVTDDGIGFAPEHLATVFERFRRVGGDSMVRGLGPGLGLYLCRGLVEAQGGRIEASSPGLGHGATFTVTLPIAEDSAPYAHP